MFFSKNRMKEWNGSTIQIIQKGIAKFSTVSEKKFHEWHFHAYFICVSFAFLIVTLSTSYTRFRCDYRKSETKNSSGKYVNDLFCKVYDSGQVQVVNSRSYGIFGENGMHFTTAMLRTMQRHTFFVQRHMND